MAGEIEKVEAAKEVFKNPLLYIGFVSVFLGWSLIQTINGGKEERLRQENRMERIVDKTVNAIDNSTRAITEQTMVITELKIIIENKD